MAFSKDKVKVELPDSSEEEETDDSYEEDESGIVPKVEVKVLLEEGPCSSLKGRKKSGRTTKYQKRYANETPEERTERLKKKRETMKRYREAIRNDPTKQDLVEALRQKEAEEKRLKRAQEPPEEKEKRYQVLRAKLRAKRAAEKEELERLSKLEVEDEEAKRRKQELLQKREVTRAKSSFHHYVRKTTMTEEEEAFSKMKNNLWQYLKQGRWRDTPQEAKEVQRKKYEDWIETLNEEKKNNILEMIKRANQQFVEGDKKIDRDKLTNKNRKRSCVQTAEQQRRYWERLKTEEPEKYNRMVERRREYDRQKGRNLTPEKIELRRQCTRVSQAKRRLKERLEKQGVRKEVIERRLEELKIELWKEFDPNWEPVREGEVRRRRRRVKEEEVEKKAEKRRIKELKFVCMRCSELALHQTAFESKAELLEHVTKLHPGECWPCEHCNLLKYSEKGLGIHLKVCRAYLAKMKKSKN